MSPIRRHLARLAWRSALILFPLLSQAGEGAFGWIYTLDLQPKGTWEFEQRIQRNRAQAAGQYDVWLLRSEWEYGWSENVQIAAYLNSDAARIDQNYTHPEVCGNQATCTSGFPVPSSHDPRQPFRQQGIDGYSLELIYRLSNPVLDPVGVGLYIEPTMGKRKNEFEGRLILQSNFWDDRLVVAGNLVVANEQLKFLGEGRVPESMLDILLGASYRFAPKWFAGSELRWHNDFGPPISWGITACSSCMA
ncbi:MAG: hypothetical protein FGM28_10030 [Limnohabitans sp.]|nr:hypothetical protein [Limnohabitans sp.]